MQLFYIWLLHFFSLPENIYFLLLLVIWLSVEKMFSTEPIVAFLDYVHVIYFGCICELIKM